MNNERIAEYFNSTFVEELEDLKLKIERQHQEVNQAIEVLQGMGFDYAAEKLRDAEYGAINHYDQNKL